MSDISIDAIESNDYLDKLVVGLNRDKYSKMVVGVAELIKDDKLVTRGDFRYKTEVLIELGKFLNSRETEVETQQQLLVIKPVTPFVLGFCSIPTRGLVVDTIAARKRILLVAALVLALVGALLAYLTFRGSFFSIRWKLAILFAYANGLPLLILGFLGMEYLSQTRAQLLDKAQKQINGMISDIDYRFNDVLERYAGKLNEMGTVVSKSFENNAGGDEVKEKLAEYEKLVDSFEPNDFIVADQQGNFEIFKCAGRSSDKFIQNMAKKLLDYVNKKLYTPRSLFEGEPAAKDTKIKAQQLISGEGILFDELLQKIGVIDRQQMAAEERLYYWSFFGDYAKREFEYLVMIAWPHEKLQEKYLKDFLSDFNDNEQQIKFYAMVETNGITHPDKKVPAPVEKLFRQIFNLKLVRTDSLLLDGEPYTAYGSVGRHMNRVALVGVYPMHIIAAHLQNIRLRLILFAFLSLCLTSGIAIMLARQFLEPVKELENGVKAIGAQNFRYRIPINTEDEFGHLSTVFNQAIESLEDLEVAKIVQENLFPADPLAHGGLQVFGKSVSMTRLGGDYYDYFVIDDDYLGILMGDVAGHGVPAALLMAMAKASVLLAADEDRHSPAALLQLLHKVIYTVKSSKIRRMMTCQYFCINSTTGAFKFSNAGHCFPAIIRDKGHYFELVESIGTPLGISKRARYKDEDHQLQPGDIMILYTDGIIETKNEQGEEMGFDNFQRILCDSYSEDLEKYYNNIFNAYLAWSPSAEDDITFVLYRFKTRENLEDGKDG
jgi:serine phosphatase RsbU (regulator of sigma subunit)